MRHSGSYGKVCVKRCSLIGSIIKVTVHEPVIIRHHHLLWKIKISIGIVYFHYFTTNSNTLKSLPEVAVFETRHGVGIFLTSHQNSIFYYFYLHLFTIPVGPKVCFWYFRSEEPVCPVNKMEHLHHFWNIWFQWYSTTKVMLRTSLNPYEIICLAASKSVSLSSTFSSCNKVKVLRCCELVK